ncbi:MAG: single-stranded DNA-binding protein [Clostridia bacterium]|nr:single-stranded DNA-binding protein [Clostridia bacterium]MBQ3495323.1 single-stranded DNA-binding protein [Clostridia bacterium]MBQ4586581.1 single-stranded DNA-binding protein [Clostridia bacterium]MBQ6882982.1 single-stranded DNA-binding protein [Clostridia bacterium]MBR2933135.1 single-stranded DNA-binding protein [Clostridia bacterium]
MNKVYLIGNLTRDPELAETSSGIKVCRFAIAVNRTYAQSDGTRETDFFNITVWRNQAENCGRYLKKGSKVAIVGSLQNRSYEDKDGIKRNVTDIIASEVEFLASRSATEGEEIPQAQPRRERPKLEPVSDDDLPF